MRSHTTQFLNGAFGFLLTAVLLVPQYACSRSSSDSKLVGAWELDAMVVKVVFTYNKDHTFIAQSPDVRTTGTWRVEGDRLVRNNDKKDEGEEKETIVTFVQDILVTRVSDDKSEDRILAYKRLK